MSKVKTQKGKKGSMENKVPPKCEQSEKYHQIDDLVSDQFIPNNKSVKKMPH